MFSVLCYHSCHNKNKTGVYVLLKKKDVGCHQPVFVFVFLFLHSLFSVLLPCKAPIKTANVFFTYYTVFLFTIIIMKG